MWFNCLPCDPERPTIMYNDGVLVLCGLSTPVDPYITYYPIIEELRTYALHGSDLAIIFKYDYLNTKSINQVVEMIKIINAMKKINEALEKKYRKKLSITWMYNEIDEKIEEIGQMMKDISDSLSIDKSSNRRLYERLKFELKSY
jgi:hypothetical protein